MIGAWRASLATRDGSTKCVHFACTLREFWGAAAMYGRKRKARRRGTPVALFYVPCTVNKVSLQWFVAHEDGWFSRVSNWSFFDSHYDCFSICPVVHFTLTGRLYGRFRFQVFSSPLTSVSDGWAKCIAISWVWSGIELISICMHSEWARSSFQKNKPMSFQSIAPRKNAKISLAEISSKMMFKSLFSR